MSTTSTWEVWSRRTSSFRITQHNTNDWSGTGGSSFTSWTSLPLTPTFSTKSSWNRTAWPRRLSWRSSLHSCAAWHRKPLWRKLVLSMCQCLGMRMKAAAVSKSCVYCKLHRKKRYKTPLKCKTWSLPLHSAGQKLMILYKMRDMKLCSSQRKRSL